MDAPTTERRTDTICLRCDHEWLRQVERPAKCPSCQSKRWDEAK